MLVASAIISKIKNLVSARTSYSRVLTYEGSFQTINNQILEKEELDYLKFWVYAEYFAQKPDELTGANLRYSNLATALQDLKTTRFENGIHDDQCLISSNNEILSLPFLSPSAIDLLLSKHLVKYWDCTNERITLSKIGKFRFELCTGADQVITFWVNAIASLDVSDLSDLGKKGLTEEFIKKCINAPEVDLSSNNDLWKTLYDSQSNVSGLRQQYFKQVILKFSHESEHQNLLNVLGPMVQFDKRPSDIKAFRAFLDLILVADSKLLNNIMTTIIPKANLPDWKLKIALHLSTSSVTFDSNDKKNLLKKIGPWLDYGRLVELAKEYVDFDWASFRTIKQFAMEKSEASNDSPTFDELEKNTTKVINAIAWPPCFHILDRILGQIENSLRQASSTFSWSMIAVSSYVPDSMTNKITSIAQQFGSVTQAMKDLDQLNTQEGMTLVPIFRASPQGLNSSFSPLVKLFIDEYKQTFSEEICIYNKDLPLSLRERLKMLEPTLAKVAGRTVSESNQSIFKLQT